MVDEKFQEIDLTGCTGLRSAVESAIKKEEEAETFYREHSSKSAIPFIKQTFAYLAKEEVDHKTYLQKFKEMITGDNCDKKLPFLKAFEITVSDNKSQLTHDVTGMDNAQMAIILAAMRQEKRAEQAYIDMALSSPNDSLKRFFQALAFYERKHYNMLDSFLESIDDFRMQS